MVSKGVTWATPRSVDYWLSDMAAFLELRGAKRQVSTYSKIAARALARVAQSGQA